jgi:zinc protease
LLFGKSTVAQIAGSLLMRGTQQKNRQQIQDATDRLKAQINVNGGSSGVSANIRTLEANLADSLRVVRELLLESSFPEAEFEQVKQQRIAGLESQKTEPQPLASMDLNQHLYAQYPRGDVRHVSTIDEQIEDTKKVTLDDVRAFCKQFYGVGAGELAIAGQFDPAQARKLVEELFGGWKSAAHYERISYPYAAVPPVNNKIETPDKQNAFFTVAAPVRINDESPDYPALTIAGMIFGGTPNSRIFQRIRVTDGLSYSASAGFNAPIKDDSGRFFASAIAAPQNTPKVEAAFKDEIAKALKDGFTADEVEKTKKIWLDQRTVSRTEETSIASLLVARGNWNRTFDWDVKLEAAVAALTPEQVNQAFRKYMDPAAVSIVKAGDFKKAGAYQ